MIASILHELNAIGLIVACTAGVILLVISVSIAIDKLPK